jgi:lysophospholipase L1-like esterase
MLRRARAMRCDGRRVSLAACFWLLAITLLGASGTALSQPPAAGLTATPCPPPDPAGDARRAAAVERVLTPTPPAEFWTASAAAQPAVPADAERQIRELLARDWPNLCRYKEANAALRDAQRLTAVFMGDSITEGWVTGDPTLFVDGVVGRGIGAQTSPQMLVRFRQDVVVLAPRVVHIMAGTNDIAGNTGPTTTQDFKNNILAMIDLARANGIAVVLAGVPPSRQLYWRGDLDPRPWIRELNDWLRITADEQGLVFVDYATVLADDDGGLRADLGNDGVHPNRAGYAAMRPLAQRALTAALGLSSAREER